MENYLTRMITEYSDLYNKLHKLREFIKTSSETIDESQLSLLSQQELAMSQYAQILRERITSVTDETMENSELDWIYVTGNKKNAWVPAEVLRAEKNDMYLYHGNPTTFSDRKDYRKTK